jgi:hypothetical protein
MRMQRSAQALFLVLLTAWSVYAFTFATGSLNTGTSAWMIETSIPSANPVGANGVYDPMPATQTLVAGDTIVANACGGMKNISAAGAVTTSTADTFTTPALGNKGCRMTVCNVGANTITLDNNTNFKSIGGADIILTAEDCTQVESDGVVWRSTGSLVAN